MNMPNPEVLGELWFKYNSPRFPTVVPRTSHKIITSRSSERKRYLNNKKSSKNLYHIINGHENSHRHHCAPRNMMICDMMCMIIIVNKDDGN